MPNPNGLDALTCRCYKVNVEDELTYLVISGRASMDQMRVTGPCTS